MILRQCIPTPVGHLTLVTDTKFLIEVRWEKSSFDESHPILLLAETQLHFLLMERIFKKRFGKLSVQYQLGRRQHTGH